MAQPILVVALDATLRDRLFDRITAAGYRVDAVADAASARKRLAKDDYVLLLVERGLDIPDAGEIPTLEVSPTELDSLEDRVRDRLGGGSREREEHEG